ncbi:hypothetical protein [Microbacterium sp.]|uniref:hypothetical protein n=1 Tax=Microbacterium sp. TaxID=51671 RepID=UPI003A854FFD
MTRTTPLVRQRVRDVARAELIRLTSTYRPYGFAIAAVAVAAVMSTVAVLLAAAVTALGADYQMEGESLVRGASSAGLPTVALICGVIAMDISLSDRACGADNLTALNVPKRRRTFFARLLVVGGFSIAVGVVALSVGAIFVAGIASTTGEERALSSVGLDLSRVIGSIGACLLVVCIAHGLAHVLPGVMLPYAVFFVVMSVLPVLARALRGHEGFGVADLVLTLTPSEHIGTLTAGGVLGVVAVAVPCAWAAACLVAGVLRADPPATRGVAT